MKVVGLPLIALLTISFVGLPSTYLSYAAWGPNKGLKQDFYFGVSYGGNTTEGAKLLIDKVKGYTNFLLVNNWDLDKNETALTEICDYATSSNLHFMVFFDFISNETYLWHQTWLENAKQRWGDKFLGIYLYDEPGGKQIDTGAWDGGDYVPALFADINSSSQATDVFANLGQTQSMEAIKSREIEVFTSDYALYWYDYKAGYDSVFVELGSNNSRTQQIALCRGAADSFNKDWGAIITWTHERPPYIASGPQILQDMKTAYDAGAKYVIVFDFPTDLEGKTYGILKEEHFQAMNQFWNYAQFISTRAEKIQARAALVLPRDYGGGLRRVHDNVWAPGNLTWRQRFPVDTQSTQIWQNLNMLSDEYNLKLNVVFEDYSGNLASKYTDVYLWNETITSASGFSAPGETSHSLPRV